MNNAVNTVNSIHRIPSTVITLAALLIGASTGYLYGVHRALAVSPNSTYAAPNQVATPAISSSEPPVHIRRIAGPTNPVSYTLDLEHETHAKRLRARNAAQIQWFREQNEANYEKLFAQLGIEPATRRELFEHALKIHQAKLEASATTTQLMSAQSAYEQRLRGLLGERYPTYADYERLRPAREESDLIVAHAAQLGTTLRPEEIATLQSIVDQSAAFSARTLGSLGGPQSPPPTQAYGEQTIIFLERDQAALSLGADAVIAAARQAGFASNQIAALESYYRGQLTYYDNLLEKIRFPTASDEARIAAQVAELQRTAPAQDATRQALEAHLAAVRQRLAERARR